MDIRPVRIWRFPYNFPCRCLQPPMRVAVLLIGLLLALGTGPARVSAQAQSDSTYTVESGDTLYSIAREMGVSVRSLMRWNALEDTSLQVGQTLRIRPPPEADAPPQPAQDTTDTTDAPQAPPPSADTENATPVDTSSDSTSAPYGQHTVDAGDTFVTLALRLGTPADSLFRLNDSTTVPLSPGRTLRLPRRFAPPTHVVQSGETLYSIAGEYGVSVRALKAENDLDPNALEPGQRVRIPGRTVDLPPDGEWSDPDSTGRVAVYPDAFAGRLTASGTTYEPDDFVVSHPSLPFNSVVLLSTRNPASHTFARVIDRGPVEEGVLLDVSEAVARQLSLDPTTSPSVALRVVWVANDTD